MGKILYARKKRYQARCGEPKSFTDESKKEVGIAAAKPGVMLKSVGEEFIVIHSIVHN